MRARAREPQQRRRSRLNRGRGQPTTRAEAATQLQGGGNRTAWWGASKFWLDPCPGSSATLVVARLASTPMHAHSYAGDCQLDRHGQHVPPSPSPTRSAKTTRSSADLRAQHHELRGPARVSLGYVASLRRSATRDRAWVWRVCCTRGRPEPSTKSLRHRCRRAWPQLHLSGHCRTRCAHQQLHIKCACGHAGPELSQGCGFARRRPPEASLAFIAERVHASEQVFDKQPLALLKSTAGPDFCWGVMAVQHQIDGTVAQQRTRFFILVDFLFVASACCSNVGFETPHSQRQAASLAPHRSMSKRRRSVGRCARQPLLLGPSAHGLTSASHTFFANWTLEGLILQPGVLLTAPATNLAKICARAPATSADKSRSMKNSFQSSFSGFFPWSPRKNKLDGFTADLLPGTP